MLRNGGSLAIAEVAALLPKIQQIPKALVLFAVALGLTHLGIHFGDLPLQFRILRFQRRGILIVVLLILHPVRDGGVGRPEGGGDRLGKIYQRGRGGTEHGQQRKSDGDHRRRKQDPKSVPLQKFFQINDLNKFS